MPRHDNITLPRIRCAFSRCSLLAAWDFPCLSPDYFGAAATPNIGRAFVPLNRELENRKLHARRSDSLAVLGDAPISDVMQESLLSPNAEFASRNVAKLRMTSRNVEKWRRGFAKSL